jgi:hypothetical protein
MSRIKRAGESPSWWPFGNPSEFRTTSPVRDRRGPFPAAERRNGRRHYWKSARILMYRQPSLHPKIAFTKCQSGTMWMKKRISVEDKIYSESENTNCCLHTMPFFNFTHNVIDWITTRQSIVKYWCHIVLCVYFFQTIQRAQIEEKSKKNL